MLIVAQVRGGCVPEARCFVFTKNELAVSNADAPPILLSFFFRVPGDEHRDRFRRRLVFSAGTCADQEIAEEPHKIFGGSLHFSHAQAKS
jgi:hypothetical protein